MVHNVINLSSIYNLEGGRLTSYIADKPTDNPTGRWRRPAVLVVPGGAYRFCSKREQEVVAFEFLARGFNAFVLEYMCAPDKVRFPEQLLELGCAVDYIKKNAKAFSINPREIFAVGFSAGGHLTASLSTDYTVSQDEYRGTIDCALTAAGLIYPVISDRYGHTESHENLFRGADDNYISSRLPLTRMDERVSQLTAPAFIYSTFEDATVPSINALRYAQALAENGIRYELHIYPNGAHGMSTASAEINDTVKGIERNRRWIDDCAAFFREFCKEKI